MGIMTKRDHVTRLLVTLTCGLLLAFFASLCIGRYTVSFAECVSILTKGIVGPQVNDETAVRVVYYLRLPRTVSALLVGSSLALSGLVYQGIFENQLISPDILGVSSGACVGAAIAIIMNLSSAIVMGMAFLGGIIAVSLALFIPKILRNDSNLTLVLSGVIVNAFMNSIIGFLKYIADPSRKLQEITFWIMGSIAGTVFEDVAFVAPMIILCSLVLWLLRWRINVLSIGEDAAAGLGVDYTKLRLLAILCCTLLTACAVSISGTVGWIGLIVPHIARSLSDVDYRKSIPTAMLVGGIFMIAVDMIARSISMNEIPLSIVTGFLGTPIYVLLLSKRGVRR